MLTHVLLPVNDLEVKFIQRPGKFLLTRYKLFNREIGEKRFSSRNIETITRQVFDRKCNKVWIENWKGWTDSVRTTVKSKSKEGQAQVCTTKNHGNNSQISLS